MTVFLLVQRRVKDEQACKYGSLEQLVLADVCFRRGAAKGCGCLKSLLTLWQLQIRI